jgi:hypothetical protein
LFARQNGADRIYERECGQSFQTVRRRGTAEGQELSCQQALSTFTLFSTSKAFKLEIGKRRMVAYLACLSASSASIGFPPPDKRAASGFSDRFSGCYVKVLANF